MGALQGVGAWGLRGLESRRPVSLQDLAFQGRWAHHAFSSAPHLSSVSISVIDKPDLDPPVYRCLPASVAEDAPPGMLGTLGRAWGS